jgi:hypothetical protein
MFPRIGIALFALPVCLAAQAIVEHSLGAATAAATAGAAQRLGNTVGEKVRKIGQEIPALPPKTLKPLSSTMPGTSPASSAAPSAPAPRAAPPAAEESAVALVPLTPAPAAPAAPAPSYEDPAGIQEGMDSAEVLRRFGPPSMKWSSTAGEQTLNYTRSDRGLDVQLREGKVASIRRSSASEGAIILR